MGDTNLDHDLVLENGRFTLDIQGLETSSKLCMAVAIDPIKIEVKEVTSGDKADYRRLKPCAASFGTVTMRFHVDKATHNKDLQEWVVFTRTGGKQGGDAGPLRKTITVNLCDRTRTTARSYNLHECFPISFDQSDYSVESKNNECVLQCQVGYAEVA